MARSVIAKLLQGVLKLVPQVFEAAHVLQDDAAGIGQQDVLSRPVNQALSELVLQALDGEGYGWLRAKQLFGCSRETLLAGNGSEDLKRIELHLSDAPLDDHKNYL